MSFLKHLLPGWKRGIEDKRKANAAILSAIDEELRRTEEETIQSKFLMSLDSSVGEWLDQYGRLFGVLRKDKENDSVYRQRIIDYVLLERGTIPALKKAIRSFMQDADMGVEIYEPYTNVFTLNKSKLNGEDHFLGEYYTVAVINIRIGKVFPDAIIDVINEFKPAGVTVWLTYQPNGYTPSAPIISAPLDSSEFTNSYTAISEMTGMNERIRAHMVLGDFVREDDGSTIFTTNKSKLNSLDRLAGSLSAATSFYNLATHSTTNQTFTSTTKVEDVLTSTESVSPDFYTKTNAVDNQYAIQSIDSNKSNYFYFTLDVGTYLQTKYGDQLREAEPSGAYTKDTYVSFMDNAYVQCRLSAERAVSTKCHLQVMNLVEGFWEDLSVQTLTTTKKMVTAGLSNASKNMSDGGLVFVRIFIPSNAEVAAPVYTGTPYEDNTFDFSLFGGTFTDEDYEVIVDGSHEDSTSTSVEMLNEGENTVAETYVFSLDFFELGFTKELGIKPTLVVYSGEATGINTTTILDTDTYTSVDSGEEFTIQGTSSNSEGTIDGSYK